MQAWRTVRDGAVMLGLFGMTWALSLLGYGYGF
jgi:hypothetical protein